MRRFYCPGRAPGRATPTPGGRSSHGFIIDEAGAGLAGQARGWRSSSRAAARSGGEGLDTLIGIPVRG